MMKWIYILEIGWKNLMNRKTRSMLTISGVIIGVAAIICLISIGYGFEKMTTEKISSEDSLFVFDVNLDDSDLTAISEQDASKVRNINNITDLEPGVSLAGNAILDKIKSSVVIQGLSNKYMDMFDLKLLRGERFKDNETNKIIVTTGFLDAFDIDLDKYAEKEFSVDIAVDTSLSPSLKNNEIKQITNQKIVGVVDDDSSTYIIAPYALIRKTMALDSFNIAKVRVGNRSDEQMSTARSSIESMGLSTDYIGDEIKQIQSFFKAFRYVIGGFGFVAMLVAIIGMFNTLTVSLLERTREIGVMRSNGAMRKDIWRMFLSEAIIISIIGGILGIVLGATIGEVCNLIFNVLAKKNGAEPIDFFYTPVFFLFGTVGANFVIGFLTGLYPSYRATKINVLDALKYE